MGILIVSRDYTPQSHTKPSQRSSAETGWVVQKLMFSQLTLLIQNDGSVVHHTSVVLCSSWICGLATGMVHQQDCLVRRILSSCHGMRWGPSIASRNLWALNGWHLAGKYTSFLSGHTHLKTPHRTSSEKALITSHKKQKAFVTLSWELVWLSQDEGIPTPKADTLPVSIVSRPNVHTIHAFYGFVLISSCLSSSNLALWPATRACLWGWTMHSWAIAN